MSDSNNTTFSDVDRIRCLLDRFVEANESYMRSHLRVLVLPYAGPLSVERLLGKSEQVVIAVETEHPHGEPPAGAHVVPRRAMQGCSELAFWGAAEVASEGGPWGGTVRLLCLIRGGAEGDEAAKTFERLAVESGRLYQTLPSFLAPIHATTSPRNLWLSVVYAWLRSTAWVFSDESDRLEIIGSPFAASAELWRRLLYGTTSDGRIGAAVDPPRRCDRGGSQDALLQASGGAALLDRRFRVALSFPGERRGFVQQVAEILAAKVGQDRILYDAYFEAEFARPDLDTYLQRLYHDDSALIAVFLCADYEKKEWCGLEWRAIRDVIKSRRASDVMPFRFDDTNVPGLFSIDGYVWVGNRQPAELAELIVKRLQLSELA